MSGESDIEGNLVYPCHNFSEMELRYFEVTMKSLQDKYIYVEHRNITDRYLAKLSLDRILHDFKTPLNVISGGIQIMEDPALSSCFNDNYPLELIKEGYKAAVETLEDNIDRESSAYKSKFHLSLEEINIEDFFTNIHSLFKDKIVSNKIHLDINNSVSQSKIRAGKIQLTSIIGNLLNNAINVSPPHSRIGISYRLEDDSHLFSVSNSILIPEEMRDTFYDKGNSRTKGGTGTYLVREFTNMHNGKTWFELDEPNDLTTIYVKLPIIK
jgi:signal transduction histidine kinase